MKTLLLWMAANAKFSGQKFKEKIDAIGFSNDPDLAEVFVTIGKAIADDTTVSWAVALIILSRGNPEN